MRLGFVVLALTIGCGRIGIEARTADPGDAGDTSDADITADAPKPAGCPTGTSLIADGATVCVEQVERGNDTWTNANATCQGLGRRLCADLEWATACTNAAGLVDMANDENGTNLNWEWVAEVVNNEGLKRGFDFCESMSAHEILVDSYDYRCCLDL